MTNNNKITNKHIPRLAKAINSMTAQKIQLVFDKWQERLMTR
jgi:hypothetical protein